MLQLARDSSPPPRPPDVAPRLGTDVILCPPARGVLGGLLRGSASGMAQGMSCGAFRFSFAALTFAMRCRSKMKYFCKSCEIAFKRWLP
eukprot:1885026-Prymnesium_polylepis.1